MQLLETLRTSLVYSIITELLQLCVAVYYVYIVSFPSEDSTDLLFLIADNYITFFRYVSWFGSAALLMASRCVVLLQKCVSSDILVDRCVANISSFTDFVPITKKQRGRRQRSKCEQRLLLTNVH